MNPIDSFIGVLLLIVVLPCLVFGVILGLAALFGGGVSAFLGGSIIFSALMRPLERAVQSALGIKPPKPE